MRLVSWQVLAVLGAVALVGGFLGVRGLQRMIETRALHSASLSAALISALVVQNNITEDSYGRVEVGPVGRLDMDTHVAHLRRRGQVAGLELWDLRTGALLYADDQHPSDETRLPVDEATRARLGPFIKQSRGEGLREPTLDVFLPYDPGEDGTEEVAVEVLLADDPVSQTIAAWTRLLYIGAGLIAALAVLVVWAAHRRRRRQLLADLLDPLTGLGNRKRLADSAMTSLPEPGTEGRASLLLVNLDRFREINDTLGHLAGDEVLTTVSQRLLAVCRTEDTVTRLSADEFAILVHGLPDHGGGIGVAHRIRDALREPIVIAGLSVEVDSSIGLAQSPDHGTELPTLLRCADVAMYEAKRTGSTIVVYDPRTDPRDRRRLTMLAELRRAIETDQLRLHYQPKCGADGRVELVEALIRWQHPERGLLSPAEFVPLAERTSLIKPLTEWVLGEAARQSAIWRAAGYHLTIAVNVSARNLVDDELPDAVLAASGRAGLSASALQVEITETAITSDPVRARRILTMLRGMGVSAAIDDFGAGYTSLSQLVRLPIQGLKIDRQFVVDVLDNPGHEAVIRNVVQLARDLGLTSTAEGVESTQVWKRLVELGCDEIQGYVLTAPLPPDQLLVWINNWHPSALGAALVS
jgi:diguanylate cyclase (GGDEF)-like protein